MELNKAVDPTPSDLGMKAQLEKLLSSVENGNFLEAMDFEIKNARTSALAELKPFTVGDYPNAQAKSLHDFYTKRWGIQPSRADMLAEIQALREKAAQ